MIELNVGFVAEVLFTIIGIIAIIRGLQWLADWERKDKLDAVAGIDGVYDESD